jgi:hypothetical protein
MTSLRIISARQVQSLLGMREAIEVNRAGQLSVMFKRSSHQPAFIAAAQGHADVPDRLILPFPALEGSTLFKPASIRDGGLGIKV